MLWIVSISESQSECRSRQICAMFQRDTMRNNSSWEQIYNHTDVIIFVFHLETRRVANPHLICLCQIKLLLKYILSLCLNRLLFIIFFRVSADAFKTHFLHQSRNVLGWGFNIALSEHGTNLSQAETLFAFIEDFLNLHSNLFTADIIFFDFLSTKDMIIESSARHLQGITKRMDWLLTIYFLGVVWSKNRLYCVECYARRAMKSSQVPLLPDQMCFWKIAYSSLLW